MDNEVTVRPTTRRFVPRFVPTISLDLSLVESEIQDYFGIADDRVDDDNVLERFTREFH